MKKSYLFTLILLLIVIFTLSACTKEETEIGCQHEYNETVIAPTCQNKGYTNKVCSKCGESISCDFKPVSNCVPRDEWQIIKAPTCTHEGEKSLKCKFCNSVLDSAPVPKKEHQPVTVVKEAPTCLSMGIEETYCNVCNEVLSSANLQKLTYHQYELYSVPATEASQGYTVYTCKICGDSKTGDYVDFETNTTPSEIYEKISSATVYIRAYDKGGKLTSVGSGFVISEDGKIYTNFHVINAAYSLTVEFYDNKTYNVDKILGYDESNDVALIKITKAECDYLKISSENVKTGDTVYTLGNPMGVENIFSSGIVSRESIKVNGIDCIAITAPISPGNSGGPLVNEKGEVVGINSMQIPDGQNLNFAILIEKAQAITEKTTTVKELYASKLKANAFEILANYVIVNANAYDGENPVIYTDIPETATTVGFEYIYYFDSEENLLSIQMSAINNGRKEYAIELILDGISNKYRVNMYEYATSQIVAEALVNASVKYVDFETSFENMFEFSMFRYDVTDLNKYTNQQQIFFAMYVTLFENFRTFVLNSYTGLTVSHFNFK